MLVNLALRNELESLKEKMAKTGEEIQSKLDEKEENVRMEICYITCRTELKCKTFVGIFCAKLCLGDVVSARGFLLSQLLPAVTLCVHMLSPGILKDKHSHRDVYSLLGN